MTALVTVLTIIELLLFVTASVSVAYVAVFALASLFHGDGDNRVRRSEALTVAEPHFLIIFPAYAEDSVILSSVEAALSQTYTAVDVCVVSDHMSPQTNAALARLPIRLVLATYADSTKGKALKTAMDEAFDADRHTHVLILDADNVIQPDLCRRLAQLCIPGRVAIQLHRCAKNSETDIALLDAVSEEINNSVFRRGHNVLSLPSALIGSGICFEARWFSTAVCRLQSAGEDKELEQQLLLDGHTTLFADSLPVFDEKVSSRDNFGRQRRRWLAAQFWALGVMLRSLPTALAPGSKALRWAYIDKTLQQALIPRSLLIALTAAMIFVTAVLAAVGVASWFLTVRWFLLFSLLLLALFAAIPPALRNGRLLRAAASMPLLVAQMLLSLCRIKGASHSFLHTQHGQS